MPIKINYLDNGIGIEIVASGCVTGDEIIAAHQEIYNAENLKRQKYQLIDRTECQVIDRTECQEYLVSSDDVKKIAEIDIAASMTNPDIIIAIVSATDLQFGVSRVWQVYV